MIGDMIAKIRKEKRMTKTELAKLTGINIGHLTHIEKGERNPSHKALKNICKALDVPYQQLMYTYDKTVSQEQSDYGLINYIPYDKVLAIDNISGLSDCPSNIPSSSIAIKINDDNMSPTLTNGNYAFVVFNSPLNSKEIGLFYLNKQLIIRRFYTKRGKITLKADNQTVEDIIVNENDEFYIIGKIFE